MSRNAASGQLTQPQPYSVLRVSQIRQAGRAQRTPCAKSRATLRLLVLLVRHSVGIAPMPCSMQMRSVSGCCCFPVRHIITKMLVPAVLSFFIFYFLMFQALANV